LLLISVSDVTRKDDGRLWEVTVVVDTPRRTSDAAWPSTCVQDNELTEMGAIPNSTMTSCHCHL